MPARKKTRERLERFQVELLPLPARRLTPKRAQRWLDDEFQAWADFLEQATWAVHSTEQRDDLVNLSMQVHEMVRACSAAIRGGQPVRLVGSLEDLEDGTGFPCWGTAESLARLVSIGLEAEISGELRGPTLRGAKQLSDQLLAYVQAGAREQEAARKRLDPTPDVNRLERLDELAENQRTAEQQLEERTKRLRERVLPVIECLIAEAVAGDAQRVDLLEYHRERLGAAHGFGEPGPVPRGYDAVAVERMLARGWEI